MRCVLLLRDQIAANGHPVSVIYGALPPEVRRREAERFASGESDILVATPKTKLLLPRKVPTAPPKKKMLPDRLLLPSLLLLRPTENLCALPTCGFVPKT